MKVSINSHNMSGIGESFPEHIKQTTNEAVDKYFKNRVISAKVRIAKTHKDQFSSSIVVFQRGRKHYLIKGDGNSDTPYAAFNIALCKMSKGLRRLKRKVTRH